MVLMHVPLTPLRIEIKVQGFNIPFTDLSAHPNKLILFSFTADFSLCSVTIRRTVYTHMLVFVCVWIVRAGKDSDISVLIQSL